LRGSRRDFGGSEEKDSTGNKERREFLVDFKKMMNG
jgi:hypothetical protein